MNIITLTTDFGLQDYVVGAVKGKLLQQLPQANIVDITHYLSQDNYPQAAYICSNAFKHFPENSIHIIILNLFDNSVQQIIVARHNGSFIICPDSGILTMITGEKPNDMVAIQIEGKQNLMQITSLIVDATNKIIDTGDISTSGHPIIKFLEKYPLRATIGVDWMEGQILFIDNFENVVVNITQKEFEEQRRNRPFKIHFTRNEIIDSISENYTSVLEGTKMAWFNSAGYLELAVNKGNMAGLFGLQGYNEKLHRLGIVPQNQWFYQTVRIYFN